MTAGPTTHALCVLRDPALDGPTNMARDEHLLYSERLRPAAVRIYSWSPPTVSLGYFQRHDELAQLPPELRELAVVRRTTGGGAILHDREVTYCLVIDDRLPAACRAPATLYRLVHECWRDAIGADGLQTELAPDSLPFPAPRGGPFFCFEKPGRTDLILGERKLLGSAQRRIPGRVLQHGSLLLGQRFAAHPGADLGQPPAEEVERWTEAFLTCLAAALSLEPCPTTWSAGELADIEQRRARYNSEAWTRRL
jgi:lipoate-protein ligase A